MKNIITAIVFVISFIGCLSSNEVNTVKEVKSTSTDTFLIKTYYGTINPKDYIADEEPDGTLSYLLYYITLTQEQAEVMGADSLFLVTYYNPSSNRYYKIVIDNEGNSGQKIYFDPVEAKETIKLE